MTQKCAGNPVGWAVLALGFNALAFGVSWWPFRQLSSLGVHVLWATALSYAVALAVLAAVFAWQGHWPWRAAAAHPALWGLFAASGLTNVCFNWGVTVGDVVRVVLCFYLMPVWAVLLAWGWLGERPSQRALWQLGMALLGVALVLWPDTPTGPWHVGFGELMGLAGGLSFAVTNVLLRHLRDVPSQARSASMFLGGGLCSAVLALILWPSGAVALPAAATASVWVWGIAALGLWLLAANLGLQYGATRLSSRTTALVLLIEVVFAAASSAALGASDLSARVLVGGLLVLGAAVLASWAERSA